MLYPEISKLMKGMESRYSLVIVAAKRARQLASDSSDDKTVSRAVAEIAAGKIKCILPNTQSTDSVTAENTAENTTENTAENADAEGIVE